MINEIRVGQVEGIVFNSSDAGVKYLLLKRTKERGGFWQPVTGGIRKGELAKEALIRELQEELSLKDNCFSIVDLDYEFVFELESGKQITEYVFGVELFSNNFKLSGEHEECKWVDLQQALKMLKWDSNKQAIKELSQWLKIKAIKSL